MHVYILMAETDLDHVYPSYASQHALYVSYTYYHPRRQDTNWKQTSAYIEKTQSMMFNAHGKGFAQDRLPWHHINTPRQKSMSP